LSCTRKFQAIIVNRLEPNWRARVRPYSTPIFLFIDVDALRAPSDFTTALREAVSECQVFLALIADRWLTIDEDGVRRSKNPNDFVRIEVATALRLGQRGNRSRAAGDGRTETNPLGGSSGGIPATGGTLGGPTLKRIFASPVAGAEEVFDVQMLPGTISQHISGPRADRDTSLPLRTAPAPCAPLAPAKPVFLHLASVPRPKLG
jgi:hypothetical protein